LSSEYSEGWDEEDRKFEEWERSGESHKRKYRRGRLPKKHLKELPASTKEQLFHARFELDTKRRDLICLALDKLYHNCNQNENFLSYLARLQSFISELNHLANLELNERTNNICQTVIFYLDDVQKTYEKYIDLIEGENQAHLDKLKRTLRNYIDGLILSFWYRDCSEIINASSRFIGELITYRRSLDEITRSKKDLYGTAGMENF